MATRDILEEDLVEEGLKALGADSVSDEEAAEREAIFAELSARLDQPGIQDKVLQRYGDFGRTLLADSLPSSVDPKIARALRPYLGDVSDVRIHTGKTATEAARAMEARAFAVGDRDVFFDSSDFDPTSREGGALIAHEIAHTRDASTGFALSRRYGSDTSARETFAEDLEMLYAKEFEEGGGQMVSDDMESQPNPVGSNFLPVQPDIDRHELARKIFDVMEEQQEMMADRLGSWN